MKKLCLFFVLLLVVSLLPMAALAADANGDSYNDHDVAQISTFLDQASGGTTNAEKLGYADASDPASWSDVTWVAVEGEQRALSIDWSYRGLAGDLDLSGCTALSELYCPSCGLTSLDVSGCTALSVLSCEHNSLSSLDVSSCTALSQLFCYRNAIETFNVEGCTSLTWLDCNSNKLTELDVNSCVNLSGLQCGFNRLSSLDVGGCPLEYFSCLGNPLKHISAVIEGEDVTLNTAEGYIKLTYLAYDVEGEKYVERYTASAVPESIPFSVWTGTQDGEPFSADASNVELTLGVSYDITANFASGTVYNDHDVTKMQVYLNQEPLEGPNYYQLGYDVDDPSTWSGVTWTASPDGLRISAVQWNEEQAIGGTLDLSGCTYLESVDLYGNELSGLNFNGCSALTSISCVNSYLDTLDVSGCDGLNSLKLNNCNGLLTALDLHGYVNLEHLECINSCIDTLDLGGCTALTYLDCSDNPDYGTNVISTLDVSDSAGLTTLICAGNPLTKISAFLNDTVVELTAAGPGHIEMSYGGGETAYATAMPDSSLFYCWNFEYGEMLSNETDIELYLYQEESSIYTANFVTSITYNEHDVGKVQDFLMQGSNALILGYDINDPATWTDVYWGTAGDELRIMSFNWYEGNLTGPLDLSGCTSLKNVSFYGCPLGSVDVSGCTALDALNIVQCELTSLDISGCTALTSLSCPNNLLSSLDVSGYTTLEWLSCENNSLSSLNVSGCSSLEWLTCYDNVLTSLDVSGCTSLYGLYCSNNALTELDVSDCLKLGAFDCSFNSLSSLDVLGCPIEYIVCSDNPLEHISARIEGKDITLAGAGGYVQLFYSFYYDEDNVKHIEEFSATAIADSLLFAGWTGTQDVSPFTSDAVTINLMPGSAYDVTAGFGYAVVYHANGATGGTVPDGGRYNAGVDVTVSGNMGDLSRTDCEFKAWNTAADGSGVAYSEGETLTMPAEDVTLYAVWEHAAYTITYDLGGGEAENPADYTAQTPEFTLNNPTKAGYVFTGWTGTGLSEASMSVTIPLGSTGDRSYTANWVQDAITITFDVQGGSAVDSIQVNVGEVIESAPVTARFGYTFTGWYTEDGALTEFPYTATGSVTLYAGWAAQPHTAYLSDVILSSGTINKDFSKTAYVYKITVSRSETSFTLIPTKEYDGASMTINGESVSSYTVNLDNHRNALICVMVKCGKTVRIYTFIVHKGMGQGCGLV